MSIQRESYYRLVRIKDLPTLNRNTFIQIVGSITHIDDQNIQIDDTFGKHTIEIDRTAEISVKLNQVLRVFGNWDGIRLGIEKILEWNITPEKIPILFSET